MRRKPKWVPSLSVLGVALASWLSNDALAAGPCTGHKLLRAPRAELSCSNVKPQVYPSPDGSLRAVVYPVDISLNATPDMESRVVIRTSKGDTLTSKDYASPRGFNGYYVVNAQWSPDSKFFVYSMSSSGGHSPCPPTTTSVRLASSSGARELFTRFSANPARPR